MSKREAPWDSFPDKTSTWEWCLEEYDSLQAQVERLEAVARRTILRRDVLRLERERDEANRQLAAVVEELERAWQSDHGAICRRLARGLDFRKCPDEHCQWRVRFLADIPAAGKEKG